jgi:hypothetical protein
MAQRRSQAPSRPTSRRAALSRPASWRSRDRRATRRLSANRSVPQPDARSLRRWAQRGRRSQSPGARLCAGARQHAAGDRARLCLGVTAEGRAGLQPRWTAWGCAYGGSNRTRGGPCRDWKQRRVCAHGGWPAVSPVASKMRPKGSRRDSSSRS